MKVLLVNGSPHQNGCTHRALEEIAQVFEQEGIDAQFFWLGKEPLSGCISCRSCASKGYCVFDDKVNEFLKLAKTADGFIVGTPVHFAGASGTLTSFLDRVFYADKNGKESNFWLKPAAVVMSARRAGTTATYDQINKYFGIMQMPIISSKYWNMVHGSVAEDVEEDLEGLQTMRALARNMAFFLKCKESGLQAGIPFPEQEQPIHTNFIRK